MKRYLLPPLIACVTLGAAQSRATSIAPIAAPSVRIFVASGCGLGVRRGPFDGCEIVYDGNYPGAGRSPYNGYYIGFARGGICGGRGTHLACNGFGLCRIVCN